jgi:DNA-binding MarR family transcriptional regulator
MNADTDKDVIGREMLKVIPQVMGVIRAEMRKRRRSDLSVMQFRAMVYLDLDPGASLSAVAEYLGLTLPTVSQMIDGMVEKGLVTRQESTIDRRRIRLSLTDQGRDVLEKSFSGTQAYLGEIISQLEVQELATLYQVLQLLDSLFSPARLSRPEGRAGNHRHLNASKMGHDKHP